MSRGLNGLNGFESAKSAQSAAKNFPPGAVYMLKNFILVLVIAGLCCASAFAQRGRGGNPGVSPQTIMDTPEVRVARVQLAAGAVRPSHVHNEGPFHLFVAVTGPVEVFFGPEGKEETETVAPGQVHFFKSNTPHGFKNPGSAPVTFIEIFVKNTGRAGNISPQTIQEAQSWLRKMVP
jgi:quercetin dioxygenase-like cupin family protein